MMAQKQTNKQESRAELHLEANCSKKMCIQKNTKNLSTIKNIHIYEDLSIRDVFTSILTHFGACIF